MGKLTYTVVMATYNGEKYIYEQIKSIYDQHIKPDEVLIFDDRSSDTTRDIINQFILDHHLSSQWKLIENAENKGHVRNFVEGSNQAKSDIVFYCDQDDIWEPEKTEVMLDGFNQFPDMLAGYCLREYIDKGGNIIKLRFTQTWNVSSRAKGWVKVSFSDAVKYNKSPGLCLAIRKELLSEINPIILEEGLTHDLPVGSIAALHRGYYVINQKLVRYRQHGNNVSAGRYDVKSRLTRIESQIYGRKQRVKQMKTILQHYPEAMTEKEKRQLTRAIQQTEKSIQYLQERNLIGLIRQLFIINPMMNRWIAANNLLICLKCKERSGGE